MAESAHMDHVNDYVHHLEFDLHRQPRTVKNYRDELRRLVARGVPLEPGPLAEWVSTGEDGQALAPNTRNRRLIILRGFAKYLVRRKLLPRNPTRSIQPARVPRDRKVPPTVDELRRVYAAVGAEPTSWRRTRDQAILVVLYNVGLRVSELTALNVHQVDLECTVLRDGVRKGGGTVDAPLNAEAASALEGWLAERPHGAGPALFVGGPKLARLSVRFIQKRLHELGLAAGVHRSLHPHIVRSTHATTLSDDNTDIHVIAQSLNHTSIRTTQRYIWGSTKRLRSALDRLPALRGPAGVDPDLD